MSKQIKDLRLGGTDKLDCFSTGKESTLDRVDYMLEINSLVINDIINRTGMNLEMAEKLVIPYRFFCDCSQFVPKKYMLIYNTPSEDDLTNSLEGLESVFGPPTEFIKKLFFRVFLAFDNSYVDVLQNYKFSDYELSVLYSVSLLSLLGTDVILKASLNFKLKDLLKSIQEKLTTFLTTQGTEVGYIFEPMGEMLESLKADCVGYDRLSENYNRHISVFVEFYFTALNDGLGTKDAKDYAVTESLKSAMFSLNENINKSTFKNLVININKDFSRKYIAEKFSKF